MPATPTILATRVVCIFVGVVAVFLTVLPRPLREIDFLIVGAVGTFGSFVVVFGSVARTLTRSKGNSVLPLDEA